MLCWLLTNTTYGTWLPGDGRGSVTSVRDRRPGEPTSAARIEHDRPGEAWEGSLPGLRRSAQRLMKGRPIFLSCAQAEIVLGQFQETATHRGWELAAVAVMANHYHLVIDADDLWRSDRILADLKAYATRALNGAFGRPESGTWWTGKGSRRQMRDDLARAAAINYVLYKQQQPLVVWSRELGRLV